MGRILIGFAIAAALLLAGGAIAWTMGDQAQQIETLRRRLVEVETKASTTDAHERQLRAFTVRRAIPRRLSDLVEDPRLLRCWQLDLEDLEWRPWKPHFGVDQGKLRPAGDVAGDASD